MQLPVEQVREFLKHLVRQIVPVTFNEEGAEFVDFLHHQGLVFDRDRPGQVLPQVLGQIGQAHKNAEVHDHREGYRQPVRKTKTSLEKSGQRVTDDRQKAGQDDGEQHRLPRLQPGRDDDDAGEHEQDFQALFSGFFLRSHGRIGVNGVSNGVRFPAGLQY